VGGFRERGVVAAASYEARKFGVRSAMPSVTAKRQCPDLIFVKPRFEVYKEVSRHIRTIFAEHTEIIEPLSLDEAYLDVTENIQGIASATEIATMIRAKILTETGLTASAGISYNKFLAKLASDHRKPNGQFVIPGTTCSRSGCGPDRFRDVGQTVVLNPPANSGEQSQSLQAIAPKTELGSDSANFPDGDNRSSSRSGNAKRL
jgi:hypothetical protein